MKKRIADHSVEKYLEDDFSRKHRKVVSNDNKWTTEISTVPTAKKMQTAMPTVQKVLQVTCNNETNFASEVLSSITDSSSLIANAFQEDASSTSGKMILSIRNWVSIKLGDVRKKEEKDALHALVKALCLPKGQ